MHFRQRRGQLATPNQEFAEDKDPYSSLASINALINVQASRLKENGMRSGKLLPHNFTQSNAGTADSASTLQPPLSLTIASVAYEYRPAHGIQRSVRRPGVVGRIAKEYGPALDSVIC